MKEKLDAQTFKIEDPDAKPKKKDQLENINVFGKGRRLPVFQEIVQTSEPKKKSKKKNKNKNQKLRKQSNATASTKSSLEDNPYLSS